MPSIVFITSILPERTAKSAGSPPSWTANSPELRWMSAEVRARRSRFAGGSVENKGTVDTSSIVNINFAFSKS